MSRIIKPIMHRVDSKKAPKAPPVLPKEAVQTGPKEYVDRWGVLYEVIFNGERDQYLTVKK